MQKLIFDRAKYGKELMIDAATVEELDITDDELVPTFYIICLLEKSTGHFLLDAEKIPLSNSTILFIKPGQIARVAAASFESGIFLFFEGEFLDLFFNDSFFIYKFAFFHGVSRPAFLQLEENMFAQVMQAAGEIRRELNHLQPDSDHLLRSLLYYLLIHLNRAYSQNYDSYGALITDRHLLRFKHLLEIKIRKIHRVQDYSHELGISKTYLNQICTRFLGRTSKETIRERLLLEAKKEIVFSGKDISEIAYELNFSAPPHFIRFFRQLTGKTPTQYRLEFSKW